MKFKKQKKATITVADGWHLQRVSERSVLIEALCDYRDDLVRKGDHLKQDDTERLEIAQKLIHEVWANTTR